MVLLGVDVSNHQRDIDWPAVAAAGWAFAIVKASEGIDYHDLRFPRNWAGVKAVGMSRGCYHFARPSENSPRVEADFFLSIVADDLAPGDMLALDMEDELVDADALLGNWSLEWLEHVAGVVGFKPLFYSYPSYMADHGLTDRPDLAAFPLWYASYRPDKPAPPSGWPRIAIWQDADDGESPGIGKVDTDRFDGTREGLMALGKPATGSDVDLALEREYQRERGMLGARRFKARLTRGYYTGDVLLADRGVVGPTQELTEIIRKGLTDDLVTLFEGSGWLTRY